MDSDQLYLISTSLSEHVSTVSFSNLFSDEGIICLNMCVPVAHIEVIHMSHVRSVIFFATASTSSRGQ